MTERLIVTDTDDEIYNAAGEYMADKGIKNIVDDWNCKQDEIAYKMRQQYEFYMYMKAKGLFK